MTGKERIMNILRGKIPDRLPFTPLINEYFLDTLPNGKKIKDSIDGLKFLGVDIIERWVTSFRGYYYSIYHGKDNYSAEEFESNGVKIVDRFEGNDIVTTYETPIGILDCRLSTNANAGSTKFFTIPLVKKAEDLRIYRYIWEASQPYPAYEYTIRRLDYLADEGLGMVIIPCTPLMYLAMYDMGLETMNYFLRDQKNEMENILEIMAEKSIQACKIAAESPAEAGIIPENSGTYLVSPEQFKNYCVPILNEYARAFKNSDKYIFMHACGHLRGLLDQIAKIDGLSGIESLTTPPTGDVSLEMAREVLEDMVIIGGLDPVIFLNSSPDDLEKVVRRIIDKVKPGKNFILMPSDSTPAGVPMENFKAVMDTIDKYGRWSS